MELLNELNNIFRKELNLENLELTRDMSAKDVEEWDSLTNINLIAEVESHFSME